MGVCVSKGQIHAEWLVRVVHDHNKSHAHAPFVNQSSCKKLAPEKLVQRSADTILGTPFEDIRQFYTFVKELGRGKFGKTLLCTEKSSGLQYACKSISKRKLVSKGGYDKEDIKREIQIMQHLSGQSNIVGFKGAHEDKNYVHVVMELCSGGDLYHRIKGKGYYSERDAASLFRQIVRVVHVCHFMGVMHRDLKPENFLFSNKDGSAPLKAADFGLSTFIEKGKIVRKIINMYINNLF